MKNILASIWIVLCLIALGACSNDKEQELRDKMSAPYSISQSDKVHRSKGSVEQYKQQELLINKHYVADLDSLISHSFDIQLEEFEDKELGVIKSYKYMFSWLIKGKQAMEDELQLKGNKYFNNLEIEQKEQELFLAYTKQIKALRNQFASTDMIITLRQVNISLPKENVYLGTLSDHSRNNLVIEIGTEIFGWLLGMLITWLVITVIGLTVPHIGCVVSIVCMIIEIVVSIILSTNNDNKLIDSIKEQHVKEITADYNSILDNLNQNTIQFYDKQK